MNSPIRVLEETKRPNGIVVIAILWGITSILIINQAVNVILFDLGYDPSAPEMLELSPTAREWLVSGVPTDMVLNLVLIILSFLTAFAAYGLLVARAWSYKMAMALPILTTATEFAIVGLYGSAPAELGFAQDYSLYLTLTLISLAWIPIVLTYLRKPEVKQYISGSSVKLLSPDSPHRDTLLEPISLPHWGTPEGDVIKAIVSHGRPLTWSELQSTTGFEERQLNAVLSRLFSSQEIRKVSDRGETRYRVSHKLYKDYYDQIQSILQASRKNELMQWINQWKKVRQLDFSLERGHFFLEGRHLDDFSKELISNAKSEVLIINPFIQDCDLSNTLRDVRRHGARVQIITRPPRDRNPEYLKSKQDYHSRLHREGISIVYNKKVHAKLVIVDRTIAIVSSMNFYPDSSAGASWEAGLISTDKEIVDLIVDSVPSGQA
jgi:hypothetical protein